ncbi:hypothetical protein BC835DRAFT_430356 [Cytidiella melzeri]|nr:hypothetical protein BC835DRAFT_430356 [Cytidiella melzeri]
MKPFTSLCALAPLFCAVIKTTAIRFHNENYSCSNPVSLSATDVALGENVIRFESLSCGGSVHADTFQLSGIAQAYAQCGGIGFTGSSTCVSGFFCEAWNPYFSQCMPSSTTAKTTASPPPPTAPVTSVPPAVPTPPPAINVCSQLCSNTCGTLGDLPPISEDCATIFDSITILGGSIAPTFDVPPNSIQQLTFGTCRVFFENLSTFQTETFCWAALADTASAAGTLCFPPTQPVQSLGLCTANSGTWAVGIAHS